SDIHPAAMGRAEQRSAAPGVAAQLPDLGLKLCCTLRATLRRMLEKAGKLDIANAVGAGVKPGFAILARLDQVVERCDHILSVHRRILPWPSGAMPLPCLRQQ